MTGGAGGTHQTAIGSGSATGGTSASSASAGTGGAGGAASTSSAGGTGGAADAAKAITDAASTDPALPKGGDVDVWYEAEAPENTLDNGTVRGPACKATCAAAPKAGQVCCVGGGWLKNMLGGGGNGMGGGVTFPAVTVPTAGVYDVEWWYHCGDYDNWHDNTCGGPPYPDWLLSVYDPYAEPQPGCRPHLFTVNGQLADGADHSKPYWQFPCFGSTWDILRVVTTPLYLAAGKNVVRIGAPHNRELDSVDLDAMHVVTPGKGASPRIPEGRQFGGDDGRK
jgi:hypothetical protein